MKKITVTDLLLLISSISFLFLKKLLMVLLINNTIASVAILITEN